MGSRHIQLRGEGCHTSTGAPTFVPEFKKKTDNLCDGQLSFNLTDNYKT